MSSAISTQASRFEQAPIIQLKEEPLAIAVPEMEQDELERHNAAQFIGSIVSKSTFEVDKALAEAEPHTSLHEALLEQNRPLARANVKAEVVELTFKKEHITEVKLSKDEHGHIHQHGQSMKSVQANTLMHGITSGPMFDRFQAETRNTFRLETADKQGRLEEYWFVVLSQTDTEMTDEKLDEAGFFVDTKSISMQATTVIGGELTMQSAFVAGVSEPGGERRDNAMVEAVGDALGVNLRGKTANQRIDTPILVHKSLMPNGISDLVKIADQPFNTYFGQDKPVENYDAVLEQCHELEKRFESKIDAITDQLLREASGIKSKVEAMQRLHELADKEMVYQAVFDTDIDPAVFGSVAAPYIEEARTRFAEGDNEGGIQATQRAVQTSDSRSCPFSPKADRSSVNREDEQKEDDNGECTFISKKCPECKAKNVKTRVTKNKISGSCGCVVRIK